ncbi:AMP-binding protein [Serratia fonticola]|uniref:AMP-binding protein n=1 Tax=Serratia fonticola TaxID=47917 RepID=UPI0015C6109B|nr:AMP-binding protein [Serratia fonticola]NXZ85512.1 AMP-binding protein [Serratia fonticola]
MKTVNAFLEQLQQLNIVLWESAGKLRFRAPQGVFTAELRRQVNQQKAAILAALRQQDRVQHHPEQSCEPFPLTEVQAAYLLGRTQAWVDGGTGCHGYAELTIGAPERWGADDYQEAWRRMVSCHAMLHARISSEGWQQIDPDVVVPLEVSVCATEQVFTQTQDAVRHRLKHRHYDPQMPPLIEAHIVTVVGRQATLHLSVDLIVTDFIGINVILTDFFRVLNQPDLVLQPPSLSFRDYVLHRERQRASPAGQEAYRRAETFWRQKAASLPAAMSLGELHPPETQEISYRRRCHTLDGLGWQSFLAQTRHHAITPTSVALALLGGVARRYGTQERSRITLTVLDRLPLVEDAMRIVGDFTSTILVALEHNGEKNTIEAAAEVQHQLFEALDHREVSGIEVLRMLPNDDPREQSATPIVLTSTLGVGSTESVFYTHRIEQGLSQTPQVLLDIQLSDAQGGGISIVWDARVGGYPEAVLDAAFNDFCAAFIALSEDEQRWYQPPLQRKPLQIPMIGATTEAAELVTEESLIARFCGLAQYGPQKLALIDGETEFTRVALIRRACAWRDWLYAQGSQAGDAALIVFDPGVEQVAAQLGALMAGAAFVPIDPQWPQARQRSILTTLKRSYPHQRQHWLTPQTLAPGVEELARVPADHRQVSAEDIAYIIFTSGSTGTPKGVPITHAQALTTLKALHAMLDLHEDDRVLAVSRPSFDLAIFNVFGLLRAGGALVIPTAGTTPDPGSWLQDMAQHRVTIWNSVPAQLQLLLDCLPPVANGENRQELALRVALVSGDWIPVTQPDQLRQWVPGCRFIALGGATEASIWSNYHEVAPGSRYSRSIPYGRALPGQEMRVLNADGEETVSGQIGQIVIIGPAVSSGYLGADTSAFITLSDSGQPAFLTGDLGRYLRNGEIEFLGRKDDQIKRHGHRIEPGEIAALLRIRPEVGDVAVIMTPQNQLVAVVTPARGHDCPVPNNNDVFDAIALQHQQSLSTLDAPCFARLLDTMELAALVAMQDIRQRNVSVKPEHLSLMARWDRLLNENAARLAPWQATVSLETAKHLWQQARQLAHAIDYGDQQIAYIDQCLQQLEAVVGGKVDPLALLFPEGRMEVARASYGGNLINRYLNQLIVAGVTVHARKAIDEQRPLRIIEIGAGVGGTTEPVIQRLRQFQQTQGLIFDYLFTDVSRFFLDDAAIQWPEVTTQFLDLNRSFVEQGIRLAAWDIVLCANVLHNARHIPQALTQLHGLLVPGGDLAIIDATRANAPLMITMEFKEGLTGFADERALSGEAFYLRENWQRALEASPFEHSVMFPDDAQTSDPAQSAIQMIHQTMIWAQSASQHARLNVDELNELLRQHLPVYMIPDRLLMLDAMPLTANGKVDRQAIAQCLPATGAQIASPRPNAKPLDDCQRAVASVWAEVLGMDSPDVLGPTSNFFDVGGDSLLLAKCVGGLRRAIPGAENMAWDDLLRQIVADPTLENCSRVVWRQVSSPDEFAPADEASPISELLPAGSLSGGNREGEVVCLIHDGSGGLEPYHALVNALALIEERPAVLGLSRTPGDGYLTLPAETLFESLAERYCQALRGQQIRQVYLFGYCMGGLIAAVMAEKLLESGIEVKQLIVVSSYRIPFIIEDDILLDYSLARLLHRPAADIGLDFPEGELGALINLARETYGDRIPEDCVAELAPQFPQIDAVMKNAPRTSLERLERLAGRAESGFDVATLQALRAVYVASLRAVGAFSRLGYVGNVTFLRQRGEIHFLPTLREDMTHFWRRYCLGDLTIRDIAGNHFDCLEGEGARSVATLLSEVWS